MNKSERIFSSFKLNPMIALMIISGYSLFLLTGRIIYTQSLQHSYLAWNIFLAWIPLMITVIIPHENNKGYHKPVPYFLIFLWLLFFPNAPYIITDLIHLKKESDTMFIFDALMIFSFAFTGLGIALYSLLKIREIIFKMTNLLITELLIPIFVIAGAYGIYMGRFLRWNSWDLFVAPKALLQDSICHLNNSIAIILTLLFSFLIYSSYLIFYHLNQSKQ